MHEELEGASSFEQFAELASRFCGWAESLPSDPHQEMHVARNFLAELQLAVLKLPDLENETIKGSARADSVRAVYARFLELPINGYWDVFEPLKEDEKEPVFNSMADDLSDIYGDLKWGLLLYQKGRVREAVWEWKFNHTIHWGAHLTGAQRAIHSYFFETME